jgi:CHASE2 domain-containing sensor protein
VEKGVKQDLAKPTTDLQLDELLKLCTVKLSVPGKVGWGTGFFVGPGKILTCAHVVKDAGGQPVKVCWQGQEEFSKATVQGLFADPFDLALLELQSPADHPCVYLDESVRSSSAVQPDDDLYIYGYPDDTPNGAPVTAKCEGLTGDKPPIIKYKQGQIRPGISGSPLLNRRTCKVAGIVKFTRDRSNDLGGGAVPATAIVEKFGELKDLQAKFHKKDRRWSTLLPLIRCRPRTALFASFGITAAVVLVRFLGMFQFVELKAYDHFVNTQIDAEQDSRFLVVEVDSNDIDAQREQGEKPIRSLSNQSLYALLEKLKRSQPRVIGLDLYREYALNVDEPVEAKLAELLQTQPNLITVCKVKDESLDPEAVPPPPDVPPHQVGFSDFISDNDGILRRQLLVIQPGSNSPCQADKSFSLRLANQYLQKENIRSEFHWTDEGNCQSLSFSNGVNLPMFRPYTGGYQGEQNYGGCQVLFNYRPNYNPQQMVSLEDVLADKVSADQIRNRIVLIGSVRRGENQDYWSTSYGAEAERLIPGVHLQAQMTSQIVSVALRERSLVWVLPQAGEVVWIWMWAGVGGALGWWLRLPQRLGMGISIAGVSLYGVCYIVFQFSGWLPFVPASLVLVSTGAFVWWLTFRLSSGANSSRRNAFLALNS